MKTLSEFLSGRMKKRKMNEEVPGETENDMDSDDPADVGVLPPKASKKYKKITRSGNGKKPYIVPSAKKPIIRDGKEIPEEYSGDIENDYSAGMFPPNVDERFEGVKTAHGGNVQRARRKK